MYKVIKSFADLQDDGHKYNVGDEYPRAGLKVSEARISKLASRTNRQGMPLIEEIKDKPLVNTPPSHPKAGQGETPEVKDIKPRKNRKKD